MGQYASALGVGKLAVDFTDPIRKSNLDTRTNPADGIYISHQNQCWFVYTNGLRDLGEYSKAIKEIKDWKRQVHKTPFNYFFINYRLMGEYRIRRNLLRAFIPYRNAKRLIEKMEKPLFSIDIDEELEDEMDKGIILEKLKDIFKTKRFQLSGNVRITKENEKEGVITYEEKFIVRKEEGKLNIYGYLNPDELFFIARFYVDYLHLRKDLWKWFLYRGSCTLKMPSILFKIISKKWRKSINDAWIDAYSSNKKAINNPHIFSDIANLAKNHFKGIDYDSFVRSAKKKLPDFDEESLQMGIGAFLETDSLLGDINFQREEIDKRLYKNLDKRNIVDEINENLSKALSICDYPGIWKAYYRLARVCHALEEFDKATENAQKALDAMNKVSYEFFYKLRYIKQFKKLKTI